MIFVTVGTHSQPFNRLLEEVDRLIEQKVITEKVIAQIGNSTYQPKHFEYFKFESDEKIIKYNKEARLIITHAGVGNILTALFYNKPIIAVPRLKKFGEHINDHQLQLVEILAKQKKIIPSYEVYDLREALKHTNSFKPHAFIRDQPIFNIISKFLINQKSHSD